MFEIRDPVTLDPSELPPQLPQIFELKVAQLYRIQDKTDSPVLYLESEYVRRSGSAVFAKADSRQALKIHRHDLLNLAKHILQTLDPQPVDETLQSLKRIENDLKRN